MNPLPTVTIVDPDRKNHPRIINQSDYDPKVHTLWSDKNAKSQFVESHDGAGDELKPNEAGDESKPVKRGKSKKDE